MNCKNCKNYKPVVYHKGKGILSCVECENFKDGGKTIAEDHSITQLCANFKSKLHPLDRLIKDNEHIFDSAYEEQGIEFVKKLRYESIKWTLGMTHTNTNEYLRECNHSDWIVK